MKYIRKTMLHIILVGILFGACANKTDYPMQPEQTHDQTLKEEQMHVLDKGTNWENIVFGNGSYDYIIYDANGNEFFRERGTPEFTIIEKSLLRMDKSGGSSLLLTRFFEIEQGLYSPQYSNVLGFGHGKVAYLLLSDVSCLVAHDMFDSESNRYEFFRDFKKLFSSNPRPELVEFIDENQLYIEYYNSNDELVKETLALK